MRHTNSDGGLFPHPENRDIFTNLLHQIIDDYYRWHAQCSEAAPPTLINPLQETVAHRTAGPVGDINTVSKLVRELSGRLANQATPFPSPLYLAHMTTDTPIVASLAYFCAMLYNSNNVTPETSPVTTELEHEVSEDLCRLIGYNPDIGWAHLSSGGSTANFEAMWIARNLRSVPPAAAAHPAAADLVSDRSPSRLANMPVPQVLDLVQALSARGLLPEVVRLAAKQRRGANTSGKLLLARSAHYTWGKCADLLGLGPDDVEELELTPMHRVDVHALGTRIRSLLADGQPILAVVAMCGSSGEGAVDDLDAILRLRADCERRFGASFYVHVDAAFGGYYRSLWLQPDGTMAPFDDRPLGGSGALMKPEVHAAFRALPFADSVTVDPHKSGHSPYPAGGLVFRDRRAISLVARESAYFGHGSGNRVPFGPHTLEGGRPGAAATAVWAAHRQIGLHSQGYGRLLGGYIATAQRLHKRFSVVGRTEPTARCDVNSEVISCFAPDLSILNLSIRPREGECARVPRRTLGGSVLDSILAEATSEPLTSLYVSGNTLTGGQLPEAAEQVLRLCTMKALGPMALEVVERQLRAAVSRAVAKAGTDGVAVQAVSAPAARPGIDPF